jgi:hypothetical protein
MGKLGSKKDPADHPGNGSWKIHQFDRILTKGEPTESFGNCTSDTRILVKFRFSKKRERKKLELTANEESIILDAHEEYKVNALALEKVIDRYYKMHIPHNRIHQVLKINDKSKDEPNKQKQRKWVRYERKHSLSLVHVDWHEHGRYTGNCIPGRRIQKNTRCRGV